MQFHNLNLVRVTRCYNNLELGYGNLQIYTNIAPSESGLSWDVVWWLSAAVFGIKLRIKSARPMQRTVCAPRSVGLFTESFPQRAQIFYATVCNFVHVPNLIYFHQPGKQTPTTDCEAKAYLYIMTVCLIARYVWIFAVSIFSRDCPNLKFICHRTTQFRGTGILSWT